MAYRFQSTKWTRDLIKNENLALAFIKLAGDLELVLWQKLVIEKEVSPEEIENATLGRLIDRVQKLGLLDLPQKELLADFVQMRNAIVHQTIWIESIIADPVKSALFTCLMVKVCEFIDGWKILTDYENPTEQKNNDCLEKHQQRNAKLFEKLKNYKS